MTPPAAWASLSFFADDLPRIQSRLSGDADILPPEADRFAALAALAPGTVRVVILGQDPYPTPGHAHGFAFSVAPDVRPLPRSLGNIYKELTDEFGACPPNGDLRFWADQGVLLLNTALSVPAGQAGAHARIGWSKLTQQVLELVSKKPTAFILWGKHAQSFDRHILGGGHLVLRSAHPSPLSARRGFFGSRPFSRVNDWLIANGETPINWIKPQGGRP